MSKPEVQRIELDTELELSKMEACDVSWRGRVWVQLLQSGRNLKAIVHLGYRLPVLAGSCLKSWPQGTLESGSDYIQIHLPSRLETPKP